MNKAKAILIRICIRENLFKVFENNFLECKIFIYALFYNFLKNVCVCISFTTFLERKSIYYNIFSGLKRYCILFLMKFTYAIIYAFYLLFVIDHSLNRILHFNPATNTFILWWFFLINFNYRVHFRKYVLCIMTKIQDTSMVYKHRLNWFQLLML